MNFTGSKESLCSREEKKSYIICCNSIVTEGA